MVKSSTRIFSLPNHDSNLSQNKAYTHTKQRGKERIRLHKLRLENLISVDEGSLEDAVVATLYYLKRFKAVIHVH